MAERKRRHVPIVVPFLLQMGEVATLMGRTLRDVFRRPFEGRIFVQQLESVGVNSMSVVSLTAAFGGLVFGLQTYTGFHKYVGPGTEVYSGPIISVGLCKELIPLLVALMIAGRVGSSMAAELGTMRVTEQIDALYTMATNPMKYLVVPRFLASTIMMFFLSALGMYIGIVGGYFVGVKVLGTNPVTYINQSINNTEVQDIWYGLIKSLVFGAVVGLIGCYKGFNTAGGAEGVGKSTTGAVVVSCMLILILDYFLSALLW